MGRNVDPYPDTFFACGRNADRAIDNLYQKLSKDEEASPKLETVQTRDGIKELLKPLKYNSMENIMFIAFCLSFIICAVFGKYYVPWLIAHGARQPLKTEVEKKIYEEKR